MGEGGGRKREREERRRDKGVERQTWQEEEDSKWLMTAYIYSESQVFGITAN